MYSVTKSFKIPIGHRLSLHEGLCKNIHGHNIKIDVEVSSRRLNDKFMVIDFYDLKKIVNEVLDIWDHSLLLNQMDYEISNNIMNVQEKIFYFSIGDPTSENMCFVLYNLLYEKIQQFDPVLTLKSITIWESDESKAKYEL